MVEDLISNDLRLDNVVNESCSQTLDIEIFREVSKDVLRANIDVTINEVSPQPILLFAPSLEHESFRNDLGRLIDDLVLQKLVGAFFSDKEDLISFFPHRIILSHWGEHLSEDTRALLVISSSEVLDQGWLQVDVSDDVTSQQ